MAEQRCSSAVMAGAPGPGLTQRIHSLSAPICSCLHAIAIGLISPNNAPTAPAHCRTSSSRTARRSGLVFAFVTSSKTSGSSPHKRRLIAWATRRNRPDRSCPNRLVSSTRRAKRSAWDFVGFVIVISKKSLNRSGASAVHLTVWRIELASAPSGSTAGESAQRPVGGPQQTPRKFFARFQNIPCPVRISQRPDFILRGAAAAHQGSTSSSNRWLSMGVACRLNIFRV